MRLLFFTLLLGWSASSYGQPGLKIQIGQQTFNFQDQTRNRLITTEIWYPTSDTLQRTDRLFSPFIRQFTVRNAEPQRGKYPLILLSHGTGGGRLTLEWLAQALVAQGYVVAAVDHFGNTYDNKIPIEFLKYWERPLDISFALTQLLQVPQFKSVIDSQRVGAAGFSLGGYTVMALAGAVLNHKALVTYYQSFGSKELDIPELPGLKQHLTDSAFYLASRRLFMLKDSRIKAFFAMAPALGAGFITKQQFSEVNKPVYIVGAQGDSIAPVKTNAQRYQQLLGNARYYELSGKTGHYVMLNEAKTDLQNTIPLYFTDDPTINRHKIHTVVANLANKFFKDNLK